MSLQCINQDPRLTRYLVEQKTFDGSPMTVIDIGARDGFEPFWRPVYGDQVRFIGFEPDVRECARMNETHRATGDMFLPYAIHDGTRTRPFYVTAFPPSCSFFEPDDAFWARFPDWINLKTIRTELMETRDLSSALEQESVREVDFIKLDAEGCELAVLEGSRGVLDQFVLGISVEVVFPRVRHGQPVYSELDLHLRNRGYEMMDISLYKHPRLALPTRLGPHYPGQGQVLWGQALYMRDPVKELADDRTRGNWSLLRILKMAGLYDLFCLQDCAAELMHAASGLGLCSRELAVRCLDLAASSLAKRDVTYGQYFGELVLEGMPRFLDSVAGRFPESRSQISDIARLFSTGEVEEAITTLTAKMAFVETSVASDDEGFWQQLFFSHLKKHGLDACEVHRARTEEK